MPRMGARLGVKRDTCEVSGIFVTIFNTDFSRYGSCRNPIGQRNWPLYSASSSKHWATGRDSEKESASERTLRIKLRFSCDIQVP
jgi:hypothetical protein